MTEAFESAVKGLHDPDRDLRISYTNVYGQIIVPPFASLELGVDQLVQDIVRGPSAARTTASARRELVRDQNKTQVHPNKDEDMAVFERTLKTSHVPPSTFEYVKSSPAEGGAERRGSKRKQTSTDGNNDPPDNSDWRTRTLIVVHPRDLEEWIILLTRATHGTGVKVSDHFLPSDKREIKLVTFRDAAKHSDGLKREALKDEFYRPSNGDGAGGGGRARHYDRLVVGSGAVGASSLDMGFASSRSPERAMQIAVTFVRDCLPEIGHNFLWVIHRESRNPEISLGCGFSMFNPDVHTALQTNIEVRTMSARFPYLAECDQLPSATIRFSEAKLERNKEFGLGDRYAQVFGDQIVLYSDAEFRKACDPRRLPRPQGEESTTCCPVTFTNLDDPQEAVAMVSCCGNVFHVDAFLRAPKKLLVCPMCRSPFGKEHTVTVRATNRVPYSIFEQNQLVNLPAIDVLDGDFPFAGFIRRVVEELDRTVAAYPPPALGDRSLRNVFPGKPLVILVPPEDFSEEVMADDDASTLSTGNWRQLQDSVLHGYAEAFPFSSDFVAFTSERLFELIMTGRVDAAVDDVYYVAEITMARKDELHAFERSQTRFLTFSAALSYIIASKRRRNKPPPVVVQFIARTPDERDDAEVMSSVTSDDDDFDEEEEEVERDGMPEDSMPDTEDDD